MKLPPFTLIYQSDLEPTEANPPTSKGKAKRPSGRLAGSRVGSSAKAARPQSGSKGGSATISITKSGTAGSKHSTAHLAAIRKHAPDLAKSLKRLRPELINTLLISSAAQESRGAETDPAGETLRPVLADLQRGNATLTVALWDLDARVGDLPEIISLLNESQPVFTFFDLQAPIPSGLVIQPEHFAAWARKRLDKKISKKEREEFQSNLMFDDFYKFARGVHKGLGIDCLVGLTKQMVAFEKTGGLYWNHFSHSRQRIALVSTYDVRDYAIKAERPFEVAVAIIVVARLLVAINSRVKYHDNRGCIFDFVPDRNLLQKIKTAQIEPSCLKLINSKYRVAAEAMMQALRDYSGGAESKIKEETLAGDKRDDSYWLKKLKSLSKELSVESK